MKPSSLASEANISTRQALELLGRAVRYVRPLWPRLLGKVAILYVSLAVLLLLPWPIKFLIDQYILGLPLDEASRIPDIIRPLSELLVGSTPDETLFRVILMQISLVLLVGAAGAAEDQRSVAAASLSDGVDQSATTENTANAGFTQIGGLIGFFDFRYTMRLTQDMNHLLRTNLFAKILRRPLTEHYDGKTGDAVYRVMYDTASITETVYQIILTPLGSTPFAVAIVFLLGGLFADHKLIPALAFGLLLLGLVGTAPFASAIRRFSGRSRMQGADATATVEEGLGNVSLIQGLGTEKNQREHFARESWATFSRWRGLVGLVLFLILAASIPIALVLGFALESIVDLVISQSLTPGDFTVLITYFLFLGSACYQLGSTWISVQGATAGLDRVFGIIDAPETDSGTGRPCPTPLREVRLEKVSFAYSDKAKIIDGVDLRLTIGRTVALVGSAGAGKSTLAHLIPAFLQASGGRILYDGIPLEELDAESVRAQISYVFQESALVEGSISENLRRAHPEATEAEMRTALDRAGATDFIKALPEGLQTSVGVGGGKFSLGQRQRIALARALLRNSAVFILDEPTSALDREAEDRVGSALEQLREQHAVLLIAHRLSLVRNADEIVFLEHGRVLERGTHESLMKNVDGPYRRLVEMQEGTRPLQAE